MRASLSGRAAHTFLAWGVVAAAAVLAWSVPELPMPLRVLGTVVAFGLGVFIAVRSWSHLGMRLTPTSIRFERMFSSAEASWDDVVAVDLRYGTGGAGRGYWAKVTAAKGRTLPLGLLPPLDRADAAAAKAYIAEQAPDVVVNPVEPWQDRYGHWHGPLQEFDPTESLRSIRRAAVGRFVVRIEPAGDGFRVVTLDESETRVRQSETLPDLQAATAEAMRHVDAAKTAAP